jgi:hypothetical protein
MVRLIGGLTLASVLVCLAPAPDANRNAGAVTEAGHSTQDGRIARALLLADARQLANIIESSHPDPYSHGGGRIRFHYRLHRLLDAIPDSGMTRDDFIELLRPFLAAIGDQHTSIYTEYAWNRSAPGGLPFVFGIVEQDLYVQIPFREADAPYRGSILVSIEGVSIQELVSRFKQLEGSENDYFVLRQLSRGNLLIAPYLHELVPEWQDRSRITFELQRPSGEIQEITRDVPVAIDAPLRPAESAVVLPEPDDSGFLCDFIDPLRTGEELAYLRVDHMSGYREAHEMAVAVGAESHSAEELAAFSSATESFRAFVRAMRERGTSTLIVDLRKNGGGNYMMAPILIYYLYGKDVLTSIPRQVAASGGGTGRRYSELYFRAHPKVTLQEINAGRRVPLVMGDIDFARMDADTRDRRDESGRLQENPDRLETYRSAPTFYAEYQSGAYSGYYRPRTVVVLTTPWTSSSGLDMTLYLWRAGATLVGTPSAQAPNSWGNLLEWELEHSGIKGEVSSSFDWAIGDDPEGGHVLPVHFPLTYEKLRSLDFDINAEFLYAMELVPTLSSAPPR